MKHLVIYKRHNGAYAWTEVERDMPKHEFSNPGTYGLPSDLEIIAVIHNIKLECGITLVNQHVITTSIPSES